MGCSRFGGVSGAGGVVALTGGEEEEANGLVESSVYVEGGSS